MRKKKRRKRRNPLEVRVQALKVPKGMSPDTYLRALQRATVTGELPRGIEVELYWRNPETKFGRTKNWQSDEFLTALSESSEGFRTVVQRAIRRRLGR